MMPASPTPKSAPGTPAQHQSARPFGVLRIDHVVLRCADIDTMLRFYCDVLGFEVAKRNERRGLIHLRSGTAMIDLVGAAADEPGMPGRNMDHVCLRVEPFDIDGLRAYFEQLGVALSELRTRFGAEGDGMSFYLLDPEGNRVELKGPSTAA